jgi:hypothetical protein
MKKNIFSFMLIVLLSLPAYGQNLISNGDFEEWGTAKSTSYTGVEEAMPTDWTLGVGNGNMEKLYRYNQAQSSSYSVILRSNGSKGSSRILQLATTPLEVGKSYRLIYWVRGKGTIQNVVLTESSHTISEANAKNSYTWNLFPNGNIFNGTTLVDSLDLGTTWTKKECTYTVSTAGNYYLIFFVRSTVNLGNANAGDYFLLDNVQLIEDPVLSELKVRGNSLSNFSAQTLTYNVVLQSNIASPYTVAATAANTAHSVQITQAVNLTGTEAQRTATVVVTNGAAEKTYRVIFSKTTELIREGFSSGALPVSPWTLTGWFHDTAPANNNGAFFGQNSIRPLTANEESTVTLSNLANPGILSFYIKERQFTDSKPALYVEYKDPAESEWITIDSTKASYPEYQQITVSINRDRATDIRFRVTKTADYLGYQLDDISVTAYSVIWNGGTAGADTQWSDAASWTNGILPVATDNVVIRGQGNMHIDLNVDVAGLTVDGGKSLIVDAGKQLTVTNALTNNGTLTLESDAANGTATILTSAAITGSGTANVRQYLSTAGGRTWYYLASPVTGASSSLFAAADQAGYYDETTASYTGPFTEVTTLIPGRGYVVLLGAASTNPTYTFSGTLNNGTVDIPVTHTGTTAVQRGFNLVGNPYPSYLDWDAVSTANTGNVQPTIWMRTFKNGQMLFQTYNADAQIATDDETTAHIAPLQAFWVKIPADKADVAGLTLELTNAMRLHKGENDTGLRAAKTETRPLLRLQVSNGTNVDNAVILFDDRADNGFDSYDSEKMSNDEAAIPEIYSLAGTEAVAINSLTGVPENHEPALGFRTGTAGTFSISANTRQNLKAVTLIDRQTGKEFDLTTGAYEFTSDITDNITRFAVAFRAPSILTGLQNAGDPQVIVFVKDRQLIVETSGDFGRDRKVALYNITGQKLEEQTLTGNTTVIDRILGPGIYLVRIGNETKKVTVK